MTGLADAPIAAEPAAACSKQGWLKELRRSSRECFASLGLPTRRTQSWVFTDLGAFGITDLLATPIAVPKQQVPVAPPPAMIARQPCHRLVFVAGALRCEQSQIGALPEGVVVDSLAQQIANGGDGLASHLGQIAPTCMNLPMLALNTGEMGDGLFLSVGPGIDFDQTIELVFIHGDDAPRATHPRHLILLETGSAATIVERHIGGANNRTLANHVSEISVASSARLRHYTLHQGGAEDLAVVTRAVNVAAGGRYEAFTMTQGGALTRTETIVSLAGRGADCLLAGAYTLDGVSHCDNTLTVEHLVPHTTSRQLYKGIVDGHARAVFQGRIVVHAGAQRTDAHQLSKALLLSDTAEVDQKPELEIYADDVACSHGAAAGQLDPAEMFYLRSRGITEQRARQLLIQAFLGEAFDEIAHPSVRKAFQAAAQDRVAAAGREEAE